MVSAIRAAMFRKTAATGGGVITASVPAGSYTTSRIDPVNANCNISFLNDGLYSVTDMLSSNGSWLLSGNASDAEIRWTVTSGALTTGTAGTWQNLGTTRVFGVTKTNLGTTVCTGTVEIRRTSDNVVVASGSITLTAEVTEDGGAVMTL